jgi:hypothetical protein
MDPGLEAPIPTVRSTWLPSEHELCRLATAGHMDIREWLLIQMGKRWSRLNRFCLWRSLRWTLVVVALSILVIEVIML